MVPAPSVPAFPPRISPTPLQRTQGRGTHSIADGGEVKKPGPPAFQRNEPFRNSYPSINLTLFAFARAFADAVNVLFVTTQPSSAL